MMKQDIKGFLLLKCDWSTIIRIQLFCVKSTDFIFFSGADQPVGQNAQPRARPGGDEGPPGRGVRRQAGTRFNGTI